MEQKRTLWILAAVGVFLLVVLGAALILYSPSARINQTTVAAQKTSNSSNGWISLAPPVQPVPLEPAQPASERQETDEITPADSENADNSIDNINPEEIEKNRITKVGDMTVIADNATVYNLNPVQGNTDSTYTPPVYKPAEDSTTISVWSERSEQPPVVPKSETAKKAVEKAEDRKIASQNESAVTVKKTASAKAAPEKNTVKPDVKSSAQVASAKNAVNSSVKPPAKVASAPAKKQYWVQVTSLTSRKSADEARAVLDENKISADVFTYEDGRKRLFYRVRVGPYTTKAEAEYWQAKIAKIEMFASTSSYVTTTN